MSREQYSVGSLMAAMCDALRAVAPILDRVGVRHNSSWDGWESLEAQIFTSVIGEPVELVGADPMAAYGFHLEDYSNLSFVDIGHESTNPIALIDFRSRDQLFDTVRGAKLRPGVLTVEEIVNVPLADARMKLCVKKQGAIQTFEYLSY